MPLNNSVKLAVVAAILILGISAGYMYFNKQTQSVNTGSTSSNPTSTTGNPSTGSTSTTNPSTGTSSTTNPSTGTTPTTNPAALPVTMPTTNSVTGQYIVLAWNDLGMHCYNPDFKEIAVLPPYNTLCAQVIRLAGEHPTIITSGITVSYSFPNNTYSAGKSGYQNKTNFWDYSGKLFGVKLPVNVGLKGKGLSGTMDLVTDHFIAEGIPLTEYTDQMAQNPDPTKWIRDPFQVAIIVVKDSATGAVLATTPVVAPVSSEMDCYTCHSDTGDATTRYPITPTGNVNTNILALHDYLNKQTFTTMGFTPLMNSQPVLCGNCHSDNALSMPGKAGVKSLSNAMHGHHASANITNITPDTQGCYSCHPGPNTQCLRDVMSVKQGFTCITCHGSLSEVATNPNPWLNEPRCDNPSCHGANAQQTQALYRFSVGLGNIYCEACHDSTHAVAPSREPIDDLKFMILQGDPGQLKMCSVCHTSTPDDPFPHLYGRGD